MKIIRGPRKDDPKYIAREKALEGCNKCPFCKADKLNEEFGFDIGIVYKEEGRWPFRKTQTMNVRRFVCYKCGARWESEPYEFIEW